MFDTVFARQETALDATVIGYLRPWIRNSSQVPAPAYRGASPPTPEQALLMLSLTYGAGVRVNELAAMRVDALLDDHGVPRAQVHIRAETTVHFKSRKVPMHPDIRRDLLAFCNRHPDEEFVALVPLLGGTLRPRPMSAHGLERWFRELFRSAGFEHLTAASGRRMFNTNARRD